MAATEAMIKRAKELWRNNREVLRIADQKPENLPQEMRISVATDERNLLDFIASMPDTTRIAHLRDKAAKLNEKRSFIEKFVEP